MFSSSFDTYFFCTLIISALSHKRTIYFHNFDYFIMLCTSHARYWRWGYINFKISCVKKTPFFLRPTHFHHNLVQQISIAARFIICTHTALHNSNRTVTFLWLSRAFRCCGARRAFFIPAESPLGAPIKGVLICIWSPANYIVTSHRYESNEQAREPFGLSDGRAGGRVGGWVGCCALCGASLPRAHSLLLLLLLTKHISFARLRINLCWWLYRGCCWLRWKLRAALSRSVYVHKYGGNCAPHRNTDAILQQREHHSPQGKLSTVVIELCESICKNARGRACFFQLAGYSCHFRVEILWKMTIFGLPVAMFSFSLALLVWNMDVWVCHNFRDNSVWDWYFIIYTIYIGKSNF